MNRMLSLLRNTVSNHIAMHFTAKKAEPPAVVKAVNKSATKK